jgi:hypothetical protein
LGRNGWDTLLLKRAAVSGELVPLTLQKALNQFKNKEKCLLYKNKDGKKLKM